ncbi:hypothetical protein SPRA44_480002 [Serratia proteamaculans]|nr:hypothetical protein SPRA44_480002 [Serratia proteamaculans]
MAVIFHAGRSTLRIGTVTCMRVKERRPRYPVYVELFYRLTTLRTPEVMDDFMRELEQIIREASGFTGRIRCFGFAAPHIFARN